MKKKTYMDDEKMDEIKFLYKHRRHVDALKKINEYIKKYPTDYYAYVFKAMILIVKDELDEALYILNNVLLYDLDDTVEKFAYEQMATIMNKKGNKEKAIEYYKKVISGSRLLCLKARRELSIIYSESGLMKEAIDILKIDGFNNEFLNVARANVYFKKNMYGETLRELERKTYNIGNKEYAKIYETEDYINKTHAIALFTKGNVYSRMKRHENAKELFKEALKYTNSTHRIYFDVLQQLAATYYKLGDYNKTIDVCRTIIDNNDFYGRESSIYTLLCNAYIKLGNKKQVIKIKDECPNTQIKNLCDVALSISEYNFDRALSLIPNCDGNNYNAIFYELIIAYRLNKYEEFMSILDKLKNNPDYRDTRKSASEAEKMKLYMEYDRGIKDIDNLSYSDNQYKSYNVIDAINHICDRHTKNTNEHNFSLDTNIEALYNFALSNLDTSDVICDGLYDEYYVKNNLACLDGEGRHIKYIGVVCIPKTKKIITMYPINDYVSEKEEYIPKVKSKQMSRIDKFNMKYGL